MVLVRILFPCGESIYFTEEGWGLEEEQDKQEWYFSSPFERCGLCKFPQREEYENKCLCPATVERKDFTEEDMENLEQVEDN